MILDTSEALAASDRILDTFLMVQERIAQGRSEVLIEKPSEILPDDDERKTALAIRKKLLKGVQALADSVFTIEEQAQARKTAAKIGEGLHKDVLERLKSKGLENEKLIADTELVLAEARKLNAEADGLDLDNLDRRIQIVERLYRMYREMEPSIIVGLMGDAAQAVPLIPKPD